MHHGVLLSGQLLHLDLALHARAVIRARLARSTLFHFQQSSSSILLQLPFLNLKDQAQRFRNAGQKEEALITTREWVVTTRCKFNRQPNKYRRKLTDALHQLSLTMQLIFKTLKRPLLQARRPSRYVSWPMRTIQTQGVPV